MSDQLPRWRQFAGISLVLLVSVTTVLVLMRSSTYEPWADQLSLVSYSFARGFPGFNTGISSNLFVGLLHLIGPADPVQFNWFVRVVSALLYLAAGIVLAWKVFFQRSLLVFGLFIVLLATSRYPFWWLSSEVIAAAFVMFFLWSLLTRQPLWITLLFLTLYGFAKPDIILPALLVAAYLGYTHTSSWPGRIKYLFLSGAPFALFLLAGVLAAGDYRFEGRSFVSFCQHYAIMMHQHRIASSPEPWGNCDEYVSAAFGPVESVLDAVRAAPGRYMDYVFLSLAFSLRRVIYGGGFALALPAAVYASYVLWQHGYRQLVSVSLLLFTNLIPIILLSYLHVRYQARFYPLLLLLVCLGLVTTQSKRIRYLGIGYLALLLVVQLLLFIPVLTSGIFDGD